MLSAEEKNLSQIAQLAIPATEVASLFQLDDISTIEFVSGWGYDCKQFFNLEEGGDLFGREGIILLR